MDMKRFFLYAIVIAALALAGCGSDGNGGMVDNGMPDPDPPPMVTCSDGSTAASQEACDQRTMAATAAARAMAAKIAPAIADPDGDEVLAEAGELKDPMRPGLATDAEVMFSVANGGAVTVAGDTLDKNDMMDDPNDDGTKMVPVENQFMKQMATPPALDGFAGSVHERTVKKVTDTLTVYTNVGAAKDEDYQMYYSADNDDLVDSTAGISSINNDQTIGTGADQYTANVVTFGTNVSGISEHINVTAFGIGNDVSRTFTNDPETEDVDERMLTGSFNGIPGTYACNAACTVTTDDDGNVMTFSADWTFTPTEAGAKMMVQGVIPDDDFLTFGYWLQATEDDEGETTYGIRTFATGQTPSTVAGVQSLEGEATYSGKAGGMYVKKTFNDRGVGTATSSGQFTADASLTAKFGGGSVPADDHYSISGDVKNFRDGGNVIDDKWTVELMKARFGTDTTTYTSDSPVFNGNTTGEGEWQGQFFGTVVDNDEEATDPVPDTLPSGVAGEFVGHLTNGHVIGAFGATQDKKE